MDRLRARIAAVLGLLGAWALATGAAAQYPERPIRLIVPQAAGSATDNVARSLGAELAKQIGQPIVVENRPGGALTIGIDAVAKPEEFAELIRKDSARWAEVIKRSGAKID